MTILTTIACIAQLYCHDTNTTKNITFVYFLLLTLPAMYIYGEYFIYLKAYNGAKLFQNERSFFESELHNEALTTILPSLYSRYQKSSPLKKIIIVISYFCVMPILVSTHLTPWIALFFYIFMTLRYRRCLRDLTTHTVIIEQKYITIPILGFKKTYFLRIKFNEVNNYKIFTSGVYIFYKKSYVFLSDDMLSIVSLDLIKRILKKNIKSICNLSRR